MKFGIATRQARRSGPDQSPYGSRLNDPFARGSGQIGSDGLTGRGLLRVPATAVAWRHLEKLSRLTSVRL